MPRDPLYLKTNDKSSGGLAHSGRYCERVYVARAKTVLGAVSLVRGQQRSER
jgi:hypothetical protein